MATFSHLASVRYLQGQGNLALYVRLRNGAGLYYDFVSGIWDAVDATDNRQFLTEVDDGSTVESRYQATVNLPEINATTILEYVRLADFFVFAEETIPAHAAVTVGPTGGTALTSVSAVKTYLGNTKTTDDDLFARLVVAASKYFEQQANRTITLTTYTESFYGIGGSVVVTKQYPIVAVSAVTVDGVAIPACVVATDYGYRVTGNGIVLRGYEFTEGAFIELAYTAGYADVPADVEQAVIELTADRYKYRQRQGKTSESMGGESASYVPSTVPQSVSIVIDAYRKHSA
jgi:uncharacterized phiE125 gp8 family phage protein